MLHSILFLFSLLLPQAASANAHFTTLFYDDGGIVYVGLKRVVDGKNESQVITFPFAGGARTRIPLPEDIQGRDVIGLVPEKKKVFVLTLGTEKGISGPMLHVFDAQNGSWKKLGSLDCPSFTKVKLSSNNMVFFCEMSAPVAASRGRRKSSGVVAKTLSYGRERLYRNGTWRFPEFMLRYKRVNLLLEGNAPTWNRLRLKSEEGEDRIFQADELFQLPAPLEIPATAPASDS